MKEEEARAAADAVERGEHPNQERGDEELLDAIMGGGASANGPAGADPDVPDTGPGRGPVGRLRQFLDNLFLGR